MYLKSLTLKGFKSFATTTTLDFEPGVTVVVGPNGSGKSNVVDSVAWVLGAQGARALRGAHMEDVIFAGTTKLAALGRAEVTLTIDNSSGKVPLDVSEVTITRTLFRNGGSEYALNGAPCRLLDIQELLSDAGVGRQQHVIISQGNLDQILNAQPEDRRAVIEEAAGILKYRKRKEKAQRRLEGTETNLVRLQDLVREVRRQMRPLERQASAARRHAELTAGLRQLQLVVAAQDWNSQLASHDASSSIISEFQAREANLLGEISNAESAVRLVEEEFHSIGSDTSGEHLQQAEGLRQRARGLANVIAERVRSIERSRSAQIDADVAASLESEAARLATDIVSAESAIFELEPQHEQIMLRENELTELAQVVEDLAQDALKASQAVAVVAGLRGELSPLRASIERLNSTITSLQSRISDANSKVEQLEIKRDELSGQLDKAIAELPDIETAVIRDDAAHAACAYAASEAQDEYRKASDTRVAAVARADALQVALDETRTRAGSERLASLEGVVGTLADVVEIDDGWEPAFEAAAATALGGVVVEGLQSATQAIQALRDAKAPGRVLALWKEGESAIPYSRIDDLGSHVQRVRDHVRSSRSDVGDLLDRLLADAFLVASPSQAIELVVKYPHIIAVTKDGDRFAGPNWQYGAAGSGVTASKVNLARELAEESLLIEEEKLEQQTVASEKEAQARAVAETSHKKLEATSKLIANLSDDIIRLGSQIESLSADSMRMTGDVNESLRRLEADQLRIGELETQLEVSIPLESESADAVRSHKEKESQLRVARAEVDQLSRELGAAKAAAQNRLEMLRSRKEEVEARLSAIAIEKSLATQKREQLESALTELGIQAIACQEVLQVIDNLYEVVSDKRAEYLSRMSDLNTRLDLARVTKSKLTQDLESGRESVHKAEIGVAQASARLEAIREHLQRELDSTPQEALNTEMPELPDDVSPSVRLGEIEHELKSLGPVNPLALDELTELEERNEFLQAQLNDVQKTRRELEHVIRAIDVEIVQIFDEAFKDVAKNFEHLFGTLFPGGAGTLKLTDPENPLDTGVEVEAKPSGKNVRKLSLLSGGERSLTAMAFLFAVFRSRPSPFYVLDEVEAALDDVNVKRFLGLVEEFRKDAQLVIVTHQKRTMEAADCLYGVSMQPGGSSKVVSEKIKKHQSRGESASVIGDESGSVVDEKSASVVGGDSDSIVDDKSASVIDLVDLEASPSDIDLRFLDESEVNA